MWKKAKLIILFTELGNSSQVSEDLVNGLEWKPENIVSESVVTQCAEVRKREEYHRSQSSDTMKRKQQAFYSAYKLCRYDVQTSVWLDASVALPSRSWLG